jgi:hypothetical protein
MREKKIYKDYQVIDGIAKPIDLYYRFANDGDEDILIEYGRYSEENPNGMTCVFSIPKDKHTSPPAFDYIWIGEYAYGIYTKDYCHLGVLKIYPDGKVEDITRKETKGDGWVCPFEIYIPVAQSHEFEVDLAGNKYDAAYERINSKGESRVASDKYGKYYTIARKPKWALTRGTVWALAHSGQLVHILDISKIEEGVIERTEASEEIHTLAKLQDCIDEEAYWWTEEDNEIEISLMRNLSLKTGESKSNE